MPSCATGCGYVPHPDSPRPQGRLPMERLVTGRVLGEEEPELQREGHQIPGALWAALIADMAGNRREAVVHDDRGDVEGDGLGSGWQVGQPRPQRTGSRSSATPRHTPGEWPAPSHFSAKARARSAAGWRRSTSIEAAMEIRAVVMGVLSIQPVNSTGYWRHRGARLLLSRRAKTCQGSLPHSSGSAKGVGRLFSTPVNGAPSVLAVWHALQNPRVGCRLIREPAARIL